MDGKRFIQRLGLNGILSYGPATPEIELEPLNVLIGPNGSGKSNLIEALGLLQATPKDLARPIRDAGGAVADWLWKGQDVVTSASISVIADYARGPMPLRYRLAFGSPPRSGFEVVDEVIENEHASDGHDDAFFYYRWQNGRPAASRMPDAEDGLGTGRRVSRFPDDEIDPRASILSQLRGPYYPEVTYLASRFDAIRIYREWALGRNAPARSPQPTDMPNDFLSEDASNLALVINDLQHRLPTKKLVNAYLRRFYPRAEDISARLQGGGMVSLWLEERGLREPVPASRLSDGTVRFLCLLAVLCHPEPPPVVCIEEPELGLHPDALQVVADLLLEASQRTQVIVTTHSTTLVSALSSTPEAVVVCERGSDGTVLRRLEREPLEAWLEEYPLGHIWAMGEIGGNP